jgi:peptide/nickel transport system substrate-binding protein
MSRPVRSDMDGHPSPDLAVGWSANAAAIDPIFKRRGGARFHDGKSFTATDATCSLRRVQDPKLDPPDRA